MPPWIWATSGIAQTFEPPRQERQCVAMLGEDDEFLVLVLLGPAESRRSFELGLFAQIVDLLRQLQ